MNLVKNLNSGSQPLVSVITPVYNTEQYLAECIESVLVQTYHNWEYVIVNNCSTDRSLEIAQQYAQQDSRIRICNNEQFLELMPNWNHALRQISPQSKYCKVVHADDWLFPQCLARMVAVAEANPSVGLVSSYRLDENEVNLDGIPYPTQVIPGQEVCRLSLLGKLHIFGSPTSLLIRSNLRRERPSFYTETHIHADTEACYDLLQHSDMGFVHEILTFTRRHNETITTRYKRFNTRKVRDVMLVKKYGKMYLDTEEYNIRLKQVVRSYYRFLAESAFSLREKEFWAHHRDELNQLGLSLFSSQFLRALCSQLLDMRQNILLVKQGLDNRRRKIYIRV